MRKLQRLIRTLAAVLVALGGSAFAEPDDRIALVRQLPVSQLAAGYPDQPFESWLREQVGPERAGLISWEVNDCGHGRSGVVCVDALVPADDGFSLGFNIVAAGDETQVRMLYAIKQDGYHTLETRDFRTLAAALAFLRGGDEAVLVELLTKAGSSLRELPGPPDGDLIFQECGVSFSLTPADGRRVAPVSVEAGADRVSAWWEVEPGLGLPAPARGEAPRQYAGTELAALLDRHPLLKGPWWFSSGAARTVKAPVLSATLETLPINGERKLTLEFGIEPGLLERPVLGAVASPQVWDFREWPIRETSNPALLQAVGPALGGHAPKDAKLTGLLTIGPRIVVPVWSPSPLRNVALWIDGHGRPQRVPDMPAVWKQDDGGFGAYLRAFEAAPGHTALLHRREGRYSAWDAYYVLSEAGLRRCASRTIGSD